MIYFYVHMKGFIKGLTTATTKKPFKKTTNTESLWVIVVWRTPCWTPIHMQGIFSLGESADEGNQLLIFKILSATMWVLNVMWVIPILFLFFNEYSK